MTTLSLKTMMTALVAGSLALTAGGTAFARSDIIGYDPPRFQERLEKRVDRALGDTTATPDQKKKVTEILTSAATDMKGLRDKRDEARKALQDAMSAPAIDPARIEAIRAEQMKTLDDSSKRLTRALIDAGNVLNAEQRQAFFKKWTERRGKPG